MLKYCYYLNLEKRVDRKENIEAELSKSTLLKDIYRRFSAVDGSYVHPRSLPEGVLTPNAIEDILSDTITAWGLSLTQGGLGVLMSYLNLFKHISELDSPVITFEDDIILAADFDKELENVLAELPVDFDMCYLGYADLPIKTTPYSNSLSVPEGMIVCLPALIISPKGAKALLGRLISIDNQIDTVIYQRHAGLNVYVANKKIVEIKNRFTSDIQGNNSCIKNYEKQNYIVTTLAYGDLANQNAKKLAKDLQYFNQQLLVVTNKEGFFEDLDNVIEVAYTSSVFSYNKKITCFEEGFKLKNAVVYIDSDSRILYKTFKNTNTNFFLNIEPGFHPSWDWGKIIRDDNRFFTSKDVRDRLPGYGELALKICEEIGVNYTDSSHYQEGIIVVSKQYGKEQVFLNVWKELAEQLDRYEESLGSSKLGTGEGNLIGLALTYSGLTVRGTEVCNILGESLKYNFYGIHKEDYLKTYPDRKVVKSSDGVEIGKGSVELLFKDKNVDLNYLLTLSEDRTVCCSFDWNRKNNVEFLDHEFKVNNQVYHFNSDKSNEFYFKKDGVFIIEHTYDWYGERNWIKLFEYE